MSLDLTLLPILAPMTASGVEATAPQQSDGSAWLAHDILSLHDGGDLWDTIQKIGERQVPTAIECHLARDLESGECRYGRITETPYGNPLTYLKVSELRTLVDEEAVTRHWRNRAAWAALSQMPDDLPVVLYWH